MYFPNISGSKMLPKYFWETETKGMIIREEGMEGWVTKVMGNIVNNVVINLHGDR